MKKLFAFLLSLIMLLSLCACGGSESPAAEDDSITTQESEEISEAETAEADTEEIVSDEAQVSEQILVDEADIKVTMTGLTADDWYGPSLNLLIENNTGSNLTFQSANCSVNGYMVETLLSEDVAAGKKANTELSLSETDLELCGIDALATIEFSMHVFDTDSWDDYYNSQIITVNTSLADTYTQEYDDSGDVLYESEDVRIVSKGMTDDNWTDCGIVVYIENTRSNAVIIQIRDASVNGFMVDPIFSCEVAAGKRAVDTIDFMESDLESNGITSIENVELSFHIFDYDTWDTIADTEPIVLEF